MNMLHASKSVLLAAATCLTLPALFATPAVARTYERCDADGDHCVRVTCDRDGDRCWRESEYFGKDIYRHKGRWVCDSDGDRCHYEYTGKRWNPHWDSDHDRGDHDRDDR